MTAWSDYFFIRLADDIGYYVAWKGTKNNAFPDKYWRTHDSARAFIKESHIWREKVDEAFEKEVLGGSEYSEADSTSED